MDAFLDELVEPGLFLLRPGLSSRAIPGLVYHPASRFGNSEVCDGDICHCRSSKIPLQKEGRPHSPYQVVWDLGSSLIPNFLDQLSTRSSGIRLSRSNRRSARLSVGNNWSGGVKQSSHDIHSCKEAGLEMFDVN